MAGKIVQVVVANLKDNFTNQIANLSGVRQAYKAQRTLNKNILMVEVGYSYVVTLDYVFVCTDNFGNFNDSSEISNWGSIITHICILGVLSRDIF